jgi:FPC/CPF motif-containing protein YcgG
MVFNLHDQFERLRMEGTYEKLRDTILHRERALSGSVNPMLSRFGGISEARQYSGRAVGKDWACPFDPAQNRDRREA